MVAAGLVEQAATWERRWWQVILGRGEFPDGIDWAVDAASVRELGEAAAFATAVSALDAEPYGAVASRSGGGRHYRADMTRDRMSGLGVMHSPGYGGSRRAARRSRWLAVGAVALLVVLVGTAVAVKVGRDREARRLAAAARATVTDFLAAWSRGDAATAARLVVPASAGQAATLLATTRIQLHAVGASYRLVGQVSSAGQPGGRYQAQVQVAGLGTAQWAGQVPLTRAGRGWLVAFSPAVLHPSLTEGGQFRYTRVRAIRGQLLTSAGQSLSVDADLAGNLRGQVRAAKAGAEMPPGVLVGDDVGISGLERALNADLAGHAGGTLTVQDSGGRSVATLLSVAKVDGRDLTTTLDLRIQRAGERAVAGVPQAGALVAVDTASGRLVAAVNQPAGGFGRAIGGKGPPGSTFKIVTSAAALIAGVPASTRLDCSATASINGRSFKNAENESLGVIGWRQAFAKSCNTWFVRLQDHVPRATLTSTAALFGFATDPDPAAAEHAAAAVLPIGSFGGSYPAPKDRAQAAGQSIGQDLVLASPLQMASVAAAVADGTWRQPRLLAGGGTGATHPLPPGIVPTLRSFMAAVAAPGGTAAKAGLPRGTFGKTGTAETNASSADPKKTDSWFVGYRGNIAFAVEFDQAGFGADVAAPAAARFLRLLG